jgi:hypothetical protein
MPPDMLNPAITTPAATVTPMKARRIAFLLQALSNYLGGHYARNVTRALNL